MAAHIAAGNYGNLVHPVGIWQNPGDQGVSCLMVGGHFLFPAVDYPALAFRTGDNPLHRLLKIGHHDAFLILAGGQQRGLVNQVREIGPAETRGFLGQGFQVNLRSNGLSGGMHLEDGLPSHHVGQVQHHPPVEPAGPEQGRVKNIRTVGGGQHDNVGIGLETVHLHQNLIQGLLPLIVSTAQTGAAVASYCVNLVHEYDTGRIPFRLFEQVPHPGGAHADEHLYELAAADVEEGHAGLAGHGPGQQGFARPRLAYQQYSFGDARSQGQKPFRILEELHHFFQLGFRLVHAGHVGERYRRTIKGHHPRPAAAKAHRLIIAALGLAHHKQDETAEEDKRQEVQHQAEEAAQTAGAFEGDLHSGRSGFHVVIGQGLHQVGLVVNTAGELGAAGPAGNPGDYGQLIPLDDNFADFVGLGPCYHLGKG